jgi:AraC family transcriptional regulator
MVADPRVVTIYNSGREYQRDPICPDGDRSDWFAVAPEHAFAIVREHDPRAPGETEAVFRFEMAESDPSLYLWQRRLFLRLERGEIDRFEAEESVLSLVGAVVVRAAAATRKAVARTAFAAAARRDLAEAARAELARNPTCATDVTALALHLGTSPYHLCRVFRSVTGLTLHAYRLDLRLRTAMERLADSSTDLSRLASELGFSSHSHFAAVLRARYGMTPSDCRQVLRSSAA